MIRSLVLAAVVALATLTATALVAQQEPPRLTGPTPFTKQTPIPPLQRQVTDDVRRKRNYPDQPPLIPHAIEGYALDLNANKCMACHARKFTEQSQAPMISVTHFMDRDLQVLAELSPRRYFCVQCHVPQVDAPPLVDNQFQGDVKKADAKKPAKKN